MYIKNKKTYIVVFRVPAKKFKVKVIAELQIGQTDRVVSVVIINAANVYSAAALLMCSS